MQFFALPEGLIPNQIFAAFMNRTQDIFVDGEEVCTDMNNSEASSSIPTSSTVPSFADLMKIQDRPVVLHVAPVTTQDHCNHGNAIEPATVATVMIERCVVVQSQGDDFGLTTGEGFPVLVRAIKTDGPAFCAGVREGDRILKINGLPLNSTNYSSSLRMLTGVSTVVLTLLGKPPETSSLANLENLKFEQKINFSNPVMIKKDRMAPVRTKKDFSRDNHSEEGLSTINPMDYDIDDDENFFIKVDTKTPFSNLAELKTKPGHLAVFINYLLTNASPNSLFFYLLTDVFQTVRASTIDLRRWTFEIFSTFIVPNSPLCIPNSDQAIIQPIDRILCSTSEELLDSDAENLKRIFVHGRQRAVIDINSYLDEFRQKFNTGGLLSSKENDYLASAETERDFRNSEDIFFQNVNILLANADYDDNTEQNQAVISAICSVAKIYNGKLSSNYEKLIEKIPLFLEREKTSPKNRKTPSKPKLQAKGHQFTLQFVDTVHYCYHCRNVVWGLQPAIYFCNHCDVKIHPRCTYTLSDSCYPITQLRQKNTGKSKVGFNAKNTIEEPSAKRDSGYAKSTCSDSGITKSKISASVSRSQSLKQKLANITISDTGSDISSHYYDLGTRMTDDDLIEIPIDAKLRTTKCNSRTPIDVQSVSASSSCSQVNATIYPEEYAPKKKFYKCFVEAGDPDLELETEITPLEQLLSWEVIRHLKPKEKKRQEVINELFHTERTHVRNLKILAIVFRKPIVHHQILPPEMIELIFGNIEDVLNCHQKISALMQSSVEKWRLKNLDAGLYGDIGDLMESIFEGPLGEELMATTSAFCQHQQHALDLLRNRCNKEKDDTFLRFLAEAESNPLCRKLQLKDMIPVEMQRLVKYPLLLETVAKYTAEPSEEQMQLLKTVQSAKAILSAVNSAKRHAENTRRLEELQKRIDTSLFDKENTGHSHSALNLLNYRLVHDGPLTCRLNRSKIVELHVVLLENILILFTKQNDGYRLQLKTLESSKDTKWSPILPLAPLIAKEKANDKRAFFLVFNNQFGAQIYELVAGTATERKTWFKLITDQVEENKKQSFREDQPPYDVNQQVSSSSDIFETVNVVTHPRLVNANEITIQQPTIFEHAHPVLTPSEKLKRSDEIILQALLTKQSILATYLTNGEKRMDVQHLDKLSELLSSLSVAELKRREPKEVAMSSIVHGNRLLDSINQALNARKEFSDDISGKERIILENHDPTIPSVPCYKLTGIAAPLMNHLKAVMQIVQDQNNEIDTLKKQLYRYKKLFADVERNSQSTSQETLIMDNNDESTLLMRKTRASIQPIT